MRLQKYLGYVRGQKIVLLSILMMEKRDEEDGKKKKSEIEWIETRQKRSLLSFKKTYSRNNPNLLLYS